MIKKNDALNKISSSRWSKSESDFYEKYYKLYKKYPNKFFNNAFFNTHRVEFARSLFRINIYNLIKDLKGSIVELGTFKGNNLMLFYHLMLTLEPIDIFINQMTEKIIIVFILLPL